MMATSIEANKTTVISLSKSDRLSITGEGAWSYYAFDASGLQLDSGSYSDPDVIGPFSEAGTVNLTASAGSSLSYDTLPASVGNATIDSSGGIVGPNGVVLTGAELAAFKASVSGGGTPAIIGMTDVTRRAWGRIVASGVSGAERARILCAGNSTVFGTGSTSGGANSASAGWPKQLKKLLLGATCDYSIGMGGTGSVANLLSNDARWSHTGTITRWDYAWNALGGDSFGLSVGATRTFTPGGTFDTVDVFWLGNPSNGSIEVSVDGGSTVLQTINNGVAQGNYVSTVTVPAGSTAVTLKCITAGVFVHGAGARTSSAKGIEIVNVGNGGSKIEHYIDTGPFYFRNGVTATLTSATVNGSIISCTINDATAQTAVSKFRADMDSTLAFLATFGPVIYVIEPRPSSASVPFATYDILADQARASCLAMGGVVVDMRSVKDYEASLWADGLHPKAQIYALMAQVIRTGMTPW